ncbi:MAG: hypothetical protein U0703_08640 [Anaerolineae bacterium]
MASIVDTFDRNETPSSETPMQRRWLTCGMAGAALRRRHAGGDPAEHVAANAGAPDIVIALLGVTAFVTGGTFGLLGALESLRHRRLDVDMLMILAALGAAIVGEWR